MCNSLIKIKVFINLGLCMMLIFCTTAMTGSTKSKRPRPQSAPPPQVQYIESTVIEGKTTKIDILKAFGNPDGVNTQCNLNSL